MSAEMDSNINIVYVRLLGEGTDVMRPVLAKYISDGIYELLTPHDFDPEYETWEFLPGKKVRCERQGIEANLVAVAEARDDI